jgi:hypothetical protein
MLPLVIPVDDVPAVPDGPITDGILRLHDTVAEQTRDDEAHLAMALCRPGRPEITEDDDAWAEHFRLDLDEQIDGTWSLHLAAAGHVTPIVGPPPFLWRRRR